MQFMVRALSSSALRSAVAVSLLLLVAVAGCGRSDGPGPGSSTSFVPSATTATSVQSSATPSRAPSPTGPPSELAPIIEALRSRDWTRIEPLLQLRDEPCLTVVTMTTDRPPCPPGVAEGTMVPVFPAAGCHNFTYAHELPGAFTSRPDVPFRLYAIYRSSVEHPRVARLPAGELGIIEDRGALGGRVFAVSGAKIVSADFGCGLSAADLAAMVPPNTFMIAPPEP